MVIFKINDSLKTASNYQDNNQKYSVYEPVDPNVFNFTKTEKHEIVSMLTHSSKYRNSKIFYNLQSKEDLEYIDRYDFQSEEYCTDVIIRNIYPIAHYHMLLLFNYYELKPQFVDNDLIVFKVVNFIKNCEDKDVM